MSADPTHANHLVSTTLLDYHHPRIEALVQSRGWRGMSTFDAIGAIYDFVRNETLFGYNISDELPASAVLADGFGQCNTKGTLLMALLRSVGVPCRLHGFTIDKELQRGAITGMAYWLAPRSIIHSWVEVRLDGQGLDGEWLNLEGFILDEAYLAGVRATFPEARGAFCGYGVATTDILQPDVEWAGRDTYIQREGINHDFGLFDAPDDFYEQHGSNLSGLRRWWFKRVARHGMNANVKRIRGASDLLALSR